MNALVQAPVSEAPVAAPVSAPLAPEKALLRFITCGSVDDGKSTLIGRMLYDSQMIAEDQLAALDRDSKKFGTQGGALDFALLVDGLAAEREQGITIDVAYRYFKTGRRAFIVADTPGHEQYTRNMATGASTADLAIILIDARKGILPQTRRHSFIVSMIGVRHVVLAINKMDLVDYSEARFHEIVRAYRDMAKNLGFRSVAPIPISALNGDNIASLSERTPWFQGEPLLPLLEYIEAGDATLAEAPFRFPVQWVNRPNLDFRGFSGWVASGSIKPGDAVVALPSGRSSTVARIVTQDGDLPQAVAGQSVTITLADEIDVSRGDVLASVARQPEVTSQVEARLLWTSETAMQVGGTYLVKLGARTANATVAKVHHLVDIHTFEAAPGRALGLNEIAEAQLRFDRPFALGRYADNRDLGGFILIDRLSNETVAFGLVESHEPAIEAPEAPEHAHDWAKLRHDVLEKLIPAVGGGALIALGAKIFGAPLDAAVAIGLADAALRPLIRGWYADLRTALARRRANDDITPDGAGI